MKNLPLLFAAVLLSAACSFDYGEVADTGESRPDIVMEDIEYVRVEGGAPLVRFRAEYAERWEDRQTMQLREFSFEHLENNGAEINAEGQAGAASVQLDTGNVSLTDGVRINIESEDMQISTDGLQWKDEERMLLGAEEDDVDIERSDGTSFTGRGFSVDIRNRNWIFIGEVRGTYVEQDDEDEEEEAEAEEAAEEEDDGEEEP